MSATGNTFFAQGVDFVNKAIDADNKTEYEKALKLYDTSLEYFITGLKHEKNPAAKEMIQKRIKGYMDRAEILKKVLKEQEEQAQQSSTAAAKTKVRGDKEEDKDDEEKSRMRGQLSSAIVSEKPNVKWSDVAGLEGAKEALKEAVILPVKFPQLFVGKRKPWKGILLYGPPGTGKSFLAKAIATEADSTFFAISSSDLVSKWQGESERLVKQMFDMAREAKPAIIFIDEIDSLCTARSEGESESSRRIKTEFLVQMDGVGADQRGVLVLGATNVPWELDPAMRRRFEKRVYIPLPEAQARTIIVKNSIGDTPNNLTDEEFSELGVLTEGYSGSDISVVVREALMEPLRKCQVAKQFLRTATGMLTPCNSYPNCPNCPMKLKQPVSILGILNFSGSDPSRPCLSCGAERMSLYDVPTDLLDVPKIEYSDFIKALRRAHSSVAEEELERFTQWTAEFGQEGC